MKHKQPLNAKLFALLALFVLLAALLLYGTNRSLFYTLRFSLLSFFSGIFLLEISLWETGRWQFCRWLGILFLLLALYYLVP